MNDILKEAKKLVEPVLYDIGKNRSYQLIWDVLYYTRLFKYVRKDQYPKIRTRLAMATSKKALLTLCSIGLLKEVQDNVYIATDKVLPILKALDYKTATLPALPTGKGDSNELHNTDVFIEVMRTWPYFYTLLYPQFIDEKTNKPYLIPDALVVQKNDETRKYKLTFLEVERPKPQWNQWIEQKKLNYLKLAKDIQFFYTWNEYCVKLQLPVPTLEQLKFTYSIIYHEKDTSAGGHTKVPVLSSVSPLE